MLVVHINEQCIFFPHVTCTQISQFIYQLKWFSDRCRAFIKTTDDTSAFLYSRPWTAGSSPEYYGCWSFPTFLGIRNISWTRHINAASFIAFIFSGKYALLYMYYASVSDMVALWLDNTIFKPKTGVYTNDRGAPCWGTSLARFRFTYLRS